MSSTGDDLVDVPVDEQPPAPPVEPPVDLPAESDEDEVDEVDEQGETQLHQSDHISEFVRDLPDGYALCPTCLALGAVLEDPPFDPTTKTCPTCLGHGKTRTGAIAGSEVERDCATCGKRGWVNRDASEPPASPARASDFAEGATPRDVAGRTPDDPEFDWTSVTRDVEPIPLVESV